MNKKNIIAIWTIIISIGVILVCTLTLLGITKSKNTVENGLKALPKPQITGGSRGELGIDKNINESTIDDYLGRPDSIYRDMRLFKKKLIRFYLSFYCVLFFTLTSIKIWYSYFLIFPRPSI